MGMKETSDFLAVIPQWTQYSIICFSPGQIFLCMAIDVAACTWSERIASHELQNVVFIRCLCEDTCELDTVQNIVSCPRLSLSACRARGHNGMRTLPADPETAGHNPPLPTDDAAEALDFPGQGTPSATGSLLVHRENGGLGSSPAAALAPGVAFCHPSL